MSEPTNFNGWTPPGLKDIETQEKYQKVLTSFVKNTALKFLQIVYGARAVNNYKYLDDEEATEIKIADQNAFQLEASEIKPAIIAIRGSLNWNNVGMNAGLQELDMRSGVEHRTDVITASVGFSCLSRVGLEAELIACEVFKLFKYFKPTLQQSGFFTIRSMSLGSEQIVEAPGEPKLFLVPVMLSCQIQDRWKLEPKAAANLKKVVIEGLTNVRGSPIEDEALGFKTVIINEDEGGS